MEYFVKNGNLLINMCWYLEPEDIIKIKEINKKNLDPDKNKILNLIFMEGVIRNFFIYDKDDLKNNIIFSKNKKNLLACIKLKQNWKKFYEEIRTHLNNYNDEAIVKKVKDIFKIHLFLPDLRKENAHLEFESSSIHQTFMYDAYFRNFCTYNFYSKYITKDFMEQVLGIKTEANEQKKVNKEIKILREKLYFENELKKFEITFKEIASNEEYINIIMNVFNYNYEIIDNLYLKKYKYYQDKFKDSGAKKIILLLLYLTHSFIEYTKYYNYYIDSIIHNDEKTIFIEFVHKHNDIVSTALLLNSNFENINIIINQFIAYFSMYIDINNKNKTELCLSKDSLESSARSESPKSNDFNSKEKFSLYKYFSNTTKKNVYDKLSKQLCPKLKNLIESFAKDFLENFETKYKNNKNDDSDYDSDYDIDFDDDDNDKMIIEKEKKEQEDKSMKNEYIKKEPSEKEVIENMANLFVDFTINGNNANGINHTELKVSDEYIEFEEMLLNIFDNNLIQNINEGKPNSYLFDVIEAITKINTSQSNYFTSSNSLILIRRTKKRLMEKLIKTLYKKVFQSLMNSFKSHIKIIQNKILSISLSNNEILNNNEYNCNLTDLSSNKKIKVTSAVNDELKAIKEKLFAESINSFGIQYRNNEIEKLIENFLNSNGIEEVYLIKKIIWFYYRELGIYEDKNEKIIKILKYNNSNIEDNCEANKMLIDGKNF